MNIFKKFKKQLKARNKYKELERLFDEIVALFPNGYANITIHGINLSELGRNWKIGTDNTAERNDKTFDITLFGKGGLKWKY